MTQLDIVVVGELNVDMILHDLNSFPEMGKEKIARNMILTVGSASAILACNIDRLGVKVGFIGQLGRDSYADIVLGTLQQRGVDSGGIIQNDNTQTGIAVEMSFPEDYAMVTYMGAMEEFGIGGVNFDYLTKGKHMHLSSYYLQSAIRKDCVELFSRAKEAGTVFLPIFAEILFYLFVRPFALQTLSHPPGFTHCLEHTVRAKGESGGVRLPKSRDFHDVCSTDV